VLGSIPVVCLVDDDPAVLKSLGRLLASDGFAVRAFQDPFDFLRHAEYHPVPVAVVDYRMPEIGGLQVQERLRGLSAATRVIMISATDKPEVRMKALAAGACAFFAKPFDEREFLDAVRLALIPAESPQQ
jgi:two-component system response regulator FixJ